MTDAQKEALNELESLEPMLKTVELANSAVVTQPKSAAHYFATAAAMLYDRAEAIEAILEPPE